jgi:F420-non-reducing hydrogenase small subunit
MALLDAHERLVELLGGVDLVHSPLTDAPEIPDCDVVLVEGAVATERDLQVVLEARARAKTLVAVGACATLGGVGGLRNVLALDDVLAAAYGAERPVTAAGDVPALLSRVRRVRDVVPLDAEVPGCAPMTDALLEGVVAAVEGREHHAPRRNLCAECERTHAKMLEHDAGFVSDAVYSVMELDEIDPKVCLVEQGVVCMGPMTREGCGARCTAANVPCRGCMGPSRDDFEQGAKMVDALAAVLPAGAIMFLDDLIGTGYRFSLPASVIPAAYDHERGGDDA